MSEPILPDLSSIRREYGDTHFDESDALESPLLQFAHWFSDAKRAEGHDSNAMVLSTVDARGLPNARVVLLKGLEAGAFIFYTNYRSVKARELEQKPSAALTFYWPKLARQVRIRGEVERVSATQSDAYFVTRPILSQLSACVSPQSESIPSKAQLEQAFSTLVEQHHTDSAVQRPSHWGGYALTPFEMEFWQGCDNRMHDRIHYVLEGKRWVMSRLAP